MPEPMEMFAVRLPRALIKRIDAYAKRIEAEGPGIPVNRAGVVRLLIARGLDESDNAKRR